MKEISPNAQITKRGHSVADANEFLWKSSSIPSFEQIANQQTELGFHPHGYGSPEKIMITQTCTFPPAFAISWKCQGSCD